MADDTHDIPQNIRSCYLIQIIRDRFFFLLQILYSVIQFPFPLKKLTLSGEIKSKAKREQKDTTPCYQLKSKGKVLSDPWL